MPLRGRPFKRVNSGCEFGMGMRLELLVSPFVGVHTAAAEEVLILARKAQLDTEIALQALTATAGSSRMLEVRCQLMVNHEYLPATGNMDIIIQDGAMITNLAQQTGCALPLFDRALEFVRSAHASGLGSHDMAALHDYLFKHDGST
jgi:L-threonate 2-dehydrogenase